MTVQMALVVYNTVIHSSLVDRAYPATALGRLRFTRGPASRGHTGRLLVFDDVGVGR